jgi:hypothetical protein
MTTTIQARTKRLATQKHSSTARANGNSDCDYAGIMTVFNSTDGDGKGFRSTTRKELAEAIQRAPAHKIAVRNDAETRKPQRSAACKDLPTTRARRI